MAENFDREKSPKSESESAASSLNVDFLEVLATADASGFAVADFLGATFLCCCCNDLDEAFLEDDFLSEDFFLEESPSDAREALRLRVVAFLAPFFLTFELAFDLEAAAVGEEADEADAREDRDRVLARDLREF